MPSKKQTRRDTVTPGGGAAAKRWTVRPHREVGRDIADYGLTCPDFVPTLKALVEALETNPKQFPKKQGRLKNARAASLKYGPVTYRAVFTLDEKTHVVKWLSLDPHDKAYAKAEKRI